VREPRVIRSRYSWFRLLLLLHNRLIKHQHHYNNNYKIPCVN